MNTIPQTSGEPDCNAGDLDKLRGEETQKSPAIQAGLLSLTIAYLAVVSVGGIAVIGNVANTGKLWNALHQGFLNAIFQG
ncbi:hypothetical protein EHLJMEHL_01306 [Vreelandella titanicae]